MVGLPGEIGMEPVDEFQGKAYLSKEVGARYLVIEIDLGSADGSKRYAG